MASRFLRRQQDRPQAPAENRAEERELIALRAYRIPDVCRLTGLGRTTIYAAIKSGDLIARKFGRSTIVLADDLQTFLQRLGRVREFATSTKSDGGRLE
jgi:excisionase family DNA binding protein